MRSGASDRRSQDLAIIALSSERRVQVHQKAERPQSNGQTGLGCIGIIPQLLTLSGVISLSASWTLK